MAQRHKFVRFGSARVKGLSDFLNQLATIPLLDTRPDLVKMRHQEEIRNNRAPTWLHVRVRRSRLLKLNDDAIARYYLAAFQFGITRAQPYAVGGPDMRTPYPSVAFVLEAIGLGWLTPEEFPYCYDK